MDNIWKVMESESPSKVLLCSQCSSEILDRGTCRECGLVVNDIEYSSYSYEDAVPTFKSRAFTPANNRIMKMQEWMMWTNDEKNEYKLNNYTKQLCQKLDICEAIVLPTCDLVSQVMAAIKSGFDGPKRSRVKDGIIIVCIYYVSKNNECKYSYIDMSKKLDLQMKYISKADKLIMELISSKKLKISNAFVENFLKTQNPIDYVTKIIDKYQLNIQNKLLEQVVSLVEICEDNDILLDHTPFSIGVSCFYYVLIINNIDINTKIFSELYDLSIVTVLKTFNKLKVYKTRFEKFGIKCLE